MKKIAVLGANEPLLSFYRQAKQLGYYIVGIAWAEGAVCRKYCDRFYDISFSDKDKVLEVCKSEHVDGIVSFSLESALPTLIYVANALGLVSNSEECLKLTQSKYAQRKALENAGISVPKYFLIETPESLCSINCPFPVIVKPVDSGGSQGICKVDKPDDLLSSYQYAVGFSRSKRVIVEEFIQGREFSVEYISHNGKHYFIQITDKVTSGAPRFVEMQHHQPADISVEVSGKIKDMVEAALTALKIENSASHTEILLTPNNNLFIVETGARMGGDFISSDLVRLSTGYDFVDGVIKLAINQFEEPVFPYSKHSGVYFYSKLAPGVGDVIRRHKLWPEIVEWEISEEPLMEVRSNADRRGYFLYQKSNNKLVLKNG